MGGEIVRVRRAEALPLLERWALFSALRSAGLLVRRWLANFGDALRGRSGEFTVAYPSEGRESLRARRGMPVLVARDDGSPRCIPCGACTSICPSRCIVVLPRSDGAPDQPERFEIDMSRCIFCGQCEEVCPEDAIVMSGEVAIADFERRSLRFDLSNLLVPEELLEGPLARRRAK